MELFHCTQDEVERQAALLAKRVVGPCALFLWGPMGAGKSTFARAFLRSYFDDSQLIVPSPTFTLVQTYAAKPPKSEVWHVDLYRLSSPEEAGELGLDEAFAQHICLVEWPDRWGGALPRRLMNIFLEPQADGRRWLRIDGEVSL